MPVNRFLSPFFFATYILLYSIIVNGQPQIDSIRASIGVLNNAKDTINYYRDLANAFFKGNDVDSGIIYGNKMINLFKSYNKLADAYNTQLLISRRLFSINRYEAYYKYLPEIDSFYKRSDNYVAISQINGMYGDYYLMHQKEWDKALPYFMENIQLKRSGKSLDAWSIQQAFQRTVAIYTYKNQYADALKIAEENLVYAEKATPDLKASNYISIATLYRNIKNYNKALEASTEALRIYENTNYQKPYLLELYRQVASDYLMVKQHDSAYKYYQKAIEGHISLGNKDFAANLLNYIALQKEEDGDKVMAEKWNEQALSLIDTSSQFYSNIKHRTYVNKMSFLMDAKGDQPYTATEKDSLRNYLKKIQPKLQAYLKEKKQYLEQSDIEYFNLLSRAYEKTDSIEKSLYFLRRSTQIKDSIFDMDKMKSFTDLESKISVEKERNRVMLEEEAKRLQLQKEAEIRALRYEYEQMQMVAKTEEERKRLLLEEDLKRREIEFRYQQEQMAIEQKFKQEQALAKVEQEKKDALAAAAISRSNNIRNMSILGTVLSLIMVGIALWSYLQKKRDNLRIAEEKKKSDNLLLNILPYEVAEELKEKGQTRAKGYDEVSVLFTDFVGFTANSQKIGVQDLLEELNVCFTAFDNIMERNGMEKIKTIGDAYLAVSGLPHKNEQHAECAIKAALEILAFIKARKAVHPNTHDIRIGIHSGHVIAGIVGVKKFAYDIWGDTVNTAARMEQNSETGRLNISGATYALVKGKFTVEPRGHIQAKGKGAIEMYFVEG